MIKGNLLIHFRYEDLLQKIQNKLFRFYNRD